MMITDGAAGIVFVRLRTQNQKMHALEPVACTNSSRLSLTLLNEGSPNEFLFVSAKNIFSFERVKIVLFIF